LEEADKILGSPARYGNLQNDPGWQKDEYYLVHAEGYEYGDEGSTSRHAIETGYSFQERGDIIARVLELLSGALKPDVPMDCDIPVPIGRTTPLAMRDFAYISATPTMSVKQQMRLETEEIQQRRRVRQQERQPIVADAIKRALSGEIMYLYIIWRERDTRDAVYRQVCKALLLDDSDDVPTHITVSEIRIDDATLLEPLDTNGITPKAWTAFEQQLRKQHIQKRDAWRAFLQRVLPRVTERQFAIVEIRSSRRKGIHPRQSIKGPIREAFALEKIGTQMLQTVTVTTTTHEGDDGETITYSAKDKGRVQNAVLEALLRQTGALYGLPAELYRQAGIPESIAHNLDVIALYRRQTNRFQGDVHFALAVRLNMTGSVDVLLPNDDTWIPYAASGYRIGQLFSDARRDRFMNNKRINSQIKLSGSELARFAACVLTQSTNRPTLVVIEADGWRNERGEDGKLWPQLKNEQL
jgi:hypothetical protein